MTDGLELIAVEEMLEAVLKGDATLTALLVAAGSAGEIYSETVPDEITYPYVRYQFQSGVDVKTHDNVIVLSRVQWIVLTMDRGRTYSRLKPIYKRIHQLLHGRAMYAAPSGLVIFGERLHPLKYPAIVDTVHYRHLGGVYRFWPQGA